MKFSKYVKDIKKTWDLINEILNKTKNKKSFPDYFLIEDEKIYDESIISNKFNKYFATIGPKLSANIKSTSGKQYHII